MLLDGETLRPRPARRVRARRRRRARARAARQPRADAVRARDRDAGLPDAGRGRDGAAQAALVRDRDRARAGHARRLGRDAPVQPLRAPADHGARPLPAPGRPAPVRGAARADLRPARPRRGRRRREGGQGRQRPDRPTFPRCSRSRRARRSGAASRPGLASSRQMVFAAFPRSGPPPRFRDYADYAEVVGQLEKTGCIADYTHIWWDIRLHPRFGTVEIRICDAVSRVEDAVALAAFCQSLVKLYSRALRGRRGDPVVPPDPDQREQVARRALRARGAGDGPRDRPPQPRAGRAARPAHAEGDRAARAGARLRAGARGHRGDPRAGATARTTSAVSGTRGTTSPTSSARSRTRRSSRQFPPSGSHPRLDPQRAENPVCPVELRRVR